MNIGETAKKAGINAKMIRHYESVGVIPKARRSSSGYRLYSEDDVQILTFVRRARSLGFSMVEIKKLVELWRNHSRTSADVKQLTVAHIKRLEQKISDLQDIRETLVSLAESCHGDTNPSCPILEDISSAGSLS